MSIDLTALKGKRAILCVSGGVDSMVLLDIIDKNKDSLGIQPVVCHFEHGIRGQESLKDMELVQSECEKRNIPFECRREDIPKLCGNVGVEECARRERYAFFYQCAKEHNADVIVLAHHRDDNCETVLMNILRGCGTKGLCGMEKEHGKLVRPLLTVSKTELYEYAKVNEIAYREDATNSDTGYLRNSIRHQLIPYMEERNPNIKEGIERMRQILSLENDYFEKLIDGIDWIIKKDYGYDIEVEPYQKSHEAIKRRSVYRVLRELSGKDYDYSIFGRIDSLCEKETGKKECAPFGVTVYKQEGKLSFVKERPTELKEAVLNNGVNVNDFGTFSCLSVENIREEELKSADKFTAYFTLEEGRQLLVRQRKDGDRMDTFGGNKKLKDILIDKKVPVFERNFLPIVWDGENILWIPGVIRGNNALMENGRGIKVTFDK